MTTDSPSGRHTISRSTSPGPGIFRLAPQFVDRVWGRRDLRPWYDHNTVRPVGEVWLTGPGCTVAAGPHRGHTLASLIAAFPAHLAGLATTDAAAGHEAAAEFPLLVKLLFPEDKLSVQVHPDDAQAAALGGDARAKTECWYVLDAAPGATVALGLRPGTTRAQVQHALGDPSFEALLHRQPVQRGDMIYVEAGTVHAIGSGMTLLEVQQSSNTTFRLYDYGRPRDLHLDEGARVIKIEAASGTIAPIRRPGSTQLIAKPHFLVDRIDLDGHTPITLPTTVTPSCLIALSGECTATTPTQAEPLPLREALILPAGTTSLTLTGQGSLLHCTVPAN